MKKTLLTTACTAAIVMGAATTSFAAANPFSDVPTEHWAYDAVQQLVKDGVVEGYPDQTFQGDKAITRYEMAQMIAKAMAKKNVPVSDKPLIDKLAAEFADELNNLGARVANLEKNADNVKWNGVFESTYASTRHDTNTGRKDKKNAETYTFRFEPTATLNDNWKVHARLDADGDYKNDSSGEVSLKRVWAEGQYGDFNIKLGKFSNAINLLSITDDPYSGVAVTFGKNWQVTAEAGRIDDAHFIDMSRDKNGMLSKDAFANNNDTANYQAAMLGSAVGKLAANVAYQHLTSTFNQKELPVAYYNGKLGRTDYAANIWSAQGGYAFDKNSFLKAEYAKNLKADNEDTAYSVEYDYRGAVPANRGSWGVYLAYRNIGQYASPWSTYDDALDAGQKGVETGVTWTAFRNVKLIGKYFAGKDRIADKSAKKLFARADIFF